MDQDLDFTIPSEDHTAVNNDSAARRRECLLELMDNLTPREEKVIRMRFGIDDGQAHSRKDVSAAFGITIEHVRLIEAKLLRGVRLPRCSATLKDYVD